MASALWSGTHMEQRQFGQSGLSVSVLSFGTMTVGGRDRFGKMGNLDAADTSRMLGLCREAGVTTLDTADVYSFGAAEEILGEALQGQRDDFVLVTKGYMRMGQGPHDVGLSRTHIMRACEASLRRLRTDYLDLYICHQPDRLVTVDETMRAFDDLVRQGKVRYVGCSNYSGWQMTKALGLSDRLGYQRFVSEQVYYSLQARDIEYEIVPAALDQGVGILVWSPLAGGLLSGKYRRDREAPAGSRHLTDWDEPPVRDEEGLYDIIEALVEIGEAHDVSAAQVALAWTLGRPGISSAIVGARTEEQLADNLRAAELELGAEERARLDELSAPPLLYPFWHQARTASDRLAPADLTLLGPHVSG